MGNEQSNENRNNRQPQPAQMTEAQLKRLLDAQRQQYERKLEEVEAKAAAQRKRDEAARAAAQKKADEAARATAQRIQEEAARANAHSSIHMPQTSTGIPPFNDERQRAPYSSPLYPGNQLQQAAPSAPPAPQPLFNNVYPNLNQAPPNPNYNQCNLNNNNSNPFLPPSPNQDFVFVTSSCNKFGQAQSYNNRPMPGPFRPSAPGPAPRGPTPPRGGNRGGTQRPRSVSRTRNERDSLDCPTCNTRYGMKIFSCDAGHSSCNECKTRRRTCGVCGGHITNRRSYDIEKIIAQTKAPCPHTSEGCKLYLKMEDMESHIKECPFKEQQCPLTAIFGNCHWKGKLSQMSSHFDNAHPSGRQTNVDTEMHLTNVSNNSREVHLVCVGVYNFLIHVKVNEGKVYMAIQLIGTKFSAMKWIYEIHVYNKSEHRRKYTFTDNCCSSNDNMEDVFEAGECAVLPVWYAKTFVCNEALSYKFFIKKTNEDNKGFVKNYRGRGKNHK